MMKFLNLATVTAIALLALPTLSFAAVDINSANAETISAELNGIGMKKAQAIVDYRKKHGPFRTADDLALVKGIGARTVERNRSDIKVTAPKRQ